MTYYKAPQKELLFVLKDLLNYQNHIDSLGYEEADLDTVESILPEAARFFEEEVAPHNYAANEQGSTLVDDFVHPAPVLDGVYQQLVEAGWCGLSGKTEYGGAGFPGIVGLAVQEVQQSANLGFSLLPMLSQGVVHALDLYANDQQKSAFLPQLVSGAWSGTMNLTEPQAGTDLGVIKTRAVAEGDHYKITGQKIFITWGDHQYAENIIHLVLARTPDAPEGTRGISMFIVPKYLINDDGSIGERNDLKPVGVEHKLGIHSSPTCIMQFGDKGGAVGYLVGEENKGLVYMFAMMNAARLAVGHQGVAISERAYQQAVMYAQDRVQGEVVGMGKDATIIHHPDVRRMLMQMRALTEAGRALSFEAHAAVDRSHSAKADDATKQQNAMLVELLTPLVKAWCTEAANEVTSLGIQVHGGMGFIEETGAAQHYRDARILAIYEGTNGIQAMDFIGRKTLRDGGQAMGLFLQACRDSIKPIEDSSPQMAELCQPLETALGQCEEALQFVAANPQDAGAIAFNYMMLFANTACYWMMLRSAAHAAGHLAKGESDSFYTNKIVTTKYFMNQILPRNSGYLAAVLTGSKDIMGVSAEEFLLD